MTNPKPRPPVERMFPFVLRSRGFLIGKHVIARSKSRLHFVLVTTTFPPASLQAVLSDFANYPVVQHFTSADLEKHFPVKDLRIVGTEVRPLTIHLASSRPFTPELPGIPSPKPPRLMISRRVKTVDESSPLTKSFTHGSRKKPDRAGHFLQPLESRTEAPVPGNQCDEQGSVLSERKLRSEPRKAVYDEVWQNNEGKMDFAASHKFSRLYGHKLQKPK